MVMEEQRLFRIETTLDKHTETLETIRDTISSLAVQSNQIQGLQADVSALWRKYDDLVRPKDGVLPAMRQFQASCPRAAIKWLWITAIPLGLALLSVSAVLLKVLL